MPKITPFLWFDGKAEEAVKFYTSIFQNSEIESVSSHVRDLPARRARFIALNGGPQFMFTEAISFFVSCETQQEVDYLWREALRWRRRSGAAAGSRTSSACRGRSSLQF